MSLGLDTSVMLRLLTGLPAHQAEAARALVASATEPIAISDLVVSETYFALRHHYEVPHAEAVRALNALLGDARIRSSGVARGVVRSLSGRGGSNARPGLIDRLIQADYARDSLVVATFDRDLARLDQVRLLRTEERQA